MEIKLSNDLAIEIKAIASVARCTESELLTAILRRGFGELKNEAQHHRMRDTFDAGRFDEKAILVGQELEPTRENWRKAILE